MERRVYFQLRDEEGNPIGSADYGDCANDATIAQFRKVLKKEGPNILAQVDADSLNVFKNESAITAKQAMEVDAKIGSLGDNGEARESDDSTVLGRGDSVECYPSFFTLAPLDTVVVAVPTFPLVDTVVKELLVVPKHFGKRTRSDAWFIGEYLQTKKRKTVEKSINDRVKTCFDESTSANMVVTGNPGTGKSRFYLYFILQLILRHQAEVQELDSFELVLNFQDRFHSYNYQDKMFTELNQADIRVLSDTKRVLRLIEGKSSELVGWSGVSILFASPGLDGVNGYEKNRSYTYIVPAWTLAELEDYNSLLTSKLHVPDNILISRYFKFGGIPRFIFTSTELEDNQKLSVAIASFNALEVIAYTKSKKPAIDKDYNNHVLRMVPTGIFIRVVHPSGEPPYFNMSPIPITFSFFENAVDSFVAYPKKKYQMDRGQHGSCETIDPAAPVEDSLPNGWCGVRLDGPRWEKTRYCALCRKAVPGLDHHCTWLQTCIGKANYAQFFTVACTGTLQFVLQVVYAALCLLWLHYHPLDDAGAFGVVVEVCLIACLVISVPCMFMYFVLLGFHLYLMVLGYGTYEWMLRRRKEQRAKLEAKKKKGKAADDAAEVSSTSTRESASIGSSTAVKVDDVNVEERDRELTVLVHHTMYNVGYFFSFLLRRRILEFANKMERETRDVWFRLRDLEGNPIGSAYRVKMSVEAAIVDLLDELKKNYNDTYLERIAPPSLTVFANEAAYREKKAFTKRSVQPGQDIEVDSVLELPFPSQLFPPNGFKVSKGVFEYQARSELKPLYDEVVGLWEEMRPVTINAVGTMQVTRAGCVGAVTAEARHESRAGSKPFVCYIPDCRGLLLGALNVQVILTYNNLANMPDFDKPLDTMADVQNALRGQIVILVNGMSMNTKITFVLDWQSPFVLSAFARVSNVWDSWEDIVLHAQQDDIVIEWMRLLWEFYDAIDEDNIWEGAHVICRLYVRVRYQIIKAQICSQGAVGKHRLQKNCTIKRARFDPGSEGETLTKEINNMGTNAWWILLDPMVFNYPGVDMILVTNSALVGINVTIAETHTPLAPVFEVWTPLAKSNNLGIKGLFVAPDGFVHDEDNVGILFLRDIYKELWERIDSTTTRPPIQDSTCRCKTRCGCHKRGQLCNQSCKCETCQNS
ncbi:unnamed protein product [Phytophthora lilii]|uniref:Unnamed protein product n=1 Tax=Phytophthora lilii TaxID=2077276 RepID=A0A9W6U069_9STRA|nr:unnamed protein product [Phytophthora lilii]